MTHTLTIFDVVALLKDVPEQGLPKGQVGIIVEEWTDGVYEVEFADKQGQTIAMFAVEAKDLLRLYFEPQLV